jgi:hypothetical protein
MADVRKRFGVGEISSPCTVACARKSREDVSEGTDWYSQADFVFLTCVDS